MSDLETDTPTPRAQVEAALLQMVRAIRAVETTQATDECVAIWRENNNMVNFLCVYFLFHLL
jgi:hypothetical protein